MFVRAYSTRVALLLVMGLAAVGLTSDRARAETKVFRAGAAAVDISPKTLPVEVSGGFLARQSDRVLDPLHARCLVLNDGATSLVIVVVDSLFISRELLDEVKAEAARATGIAADHMLISAVHTHSAPSVVGCLGTGVEKSYVPVLRQGIVESIVAAVKNLAPAKVGWTVVADREHTNCRRWIRRSDRIGMDPFGQSTIRAMMHPGYLNPDYIGPAGPKDPGLSILSVQSPDGRPIAVLANYSMHYFGAAPVSADYFGRFCQRFTRLIDADKSQPAFVAMMSQGTAGDLHWMDYGQPRKSINIDAYAQQVAEVAAKAYRTIRYRDTPTLAMAERKLTLGRRVPDKVRLAWAQKILGEMKGRTKPANQREVYALEQIYLDQEPRRELKLQALRVGDLGITAIPDEVFGITGLKIKAQSPLRPTFNIELANGEEGYIPPPEQHRLGGYTTWPARTASLEVQAEPKIVETVLQLLEQVAGKPRRPFAEVNGPYAQSVLASKPLAYWRMGEFAGATAQDSSGNDHPASYEGGFALYLEGAETPGFCGPKHVNRAVHFAGGYVKAPLPELGATYSVELWFWNGLPSDVRAVTGCLFACGADARNASGECLVIGGKDLSPGRLVFCCGDGANASLAGATSIVPKTWNHVVLVREAGKIRVYLNGCQTPEISGDVAGTQGSAPQVVLGARSDGSFSLEGKLDEAAVYARALSGEEIAKHFAAAGVK